MKHNSSETKKYNKLMITQSKTKKKVPMQKSLHKKTMDKMTCFSPKDRNKKAGGTNIR